VEPLSLLPGPPNWNKRYGYRRDPSGSASPRRPWRCSARATCASLQRRP